VLKEKNQASGDFCRW